MDEKPRSRVIGRSLPAAANDRNSENEGPWAAAIQEATAYAFALPTVDAIPPHRLPANSGRSRAHSRSRDEESKRNDNNNTLGSGDATAQATPSSSFDEAVNQDIRRVERALDYLDELRRLLEQQNHQEWPPYDPYDPPAFELANSEPPPEEAPNLDLPSLTETRTVARGTQPGDPSDSKPPPSTAAAAAAKKKKKKKTKKAPKDAANRAAHPSISKNRYAMIAVDSTDESSDSEDIDSDDSDDADSKTNANASIEKSLSAEAVPYVPSFSLEDEEHPRSNPIQRHLLHGPSHFHMDTMRLLIRLHASRSDLYAHKARLLAAQRNWLQGAHALQLSITAIASGVKVADEAISAILVAMDLTITNSTAFLFPQETTTAASSFYEPAAADEIPSSMMGFESFHDHRRVQLEHDAEIASVSTKYLVDEKARYIKTAHSQVLKLERILTGMWKSREAAKKRIGVKKWKSNPNSPQQSFLAQLRLQHEKELHSLECALEKLQESKEDASALADEADQLRQKLKKMRFAKHRHNGRRPIRRSPRTVVEAQGHEAEEASYLDLSPEDYGWCFTGGIDGVDCVQFFEKWIHVGFPRTPIIVGLPNESHSSNSNQMAPENLTSGTYVLVKLDFYFVTGAVQTVVEYPATYSHDGIQVNHAWSSTLKFTADEMDRTLYQKILLDPLSVHKEHGGTNVAILSTY